MSADGRGPDSGWWSARGGQKEAQPQPVESTGWASVIGVVAIVFGVLGTIAGVWGALKPWVMSSLEAGQRGGVHVTTELARGWDAWTVPLSVLAAVLALVLLVAGIRLVERKPEARRLLILWAPLMMALAVVNCALDWAIRQDMLRAQPEASASASSPVSPMPAGSSDLALALQLGWKLLLPILMLIWFSRATIKAQVAGWGKAGDQRGGTPGAVG